MNRIRITKHACLFLSVAFVTSSMLSLPSYGGQMVWITTVHREKALVRIRRDVPVARLESPCPAVVGDVVAGDFVRAGRDFLLVKAQIRNRAERPLQRVDVVVRAYDAYKRVLHHQILFSTRTTQPGDVAPVEIHWGTPRGATVRTELQVVGLAFTDGEFCEVSGGRDEVIRRFAPAEAQLMGGAPGDEMLRYVQHRLNQLGYDCGRADGLWGSKTRSCIASFQRDKDLAATGMIDPPTLRRMHDD